MCPAYPEVRVQLQPSNKDREAAFTIMNVVRCALKTAGISCRERVRFMEEASRFMEEASLGLEDYAYALRVCSDWVTVEDD